MAFTKKEIDAALKSRAERFAHQAQDVIEPEPIEEYILSDQSIKLKKKRLLGRRSLIFIACIAIIACIATALMVGRYIFGGSLEKQAGENLQRLQDKVAADSREKYEMAKRNGSPMEICILAGLTAAAYLQAKDESNYTRWNQIAHDDCAIPGLPR